MWPFRLSRQEPGEGGQRLLARMVLEALGVLFGGFGIEANGDQEADDQIVPRLRGLCHLGAGLGQEQAAIGLGLDQPVALEAADRRGDGGLGDAHATRKVHRARLAFLAQKVGDEFDVILGRRGAVGLALAGEAGGVVLGGGRGAASAAGRRMVGTGFPSWDAFDSASIIT